MTIHLHVRSSDQDQIDQKALIQAAQAVLDVLDRNEDQEVSIIITDNEQLRQLNRSFRGIDEATDVLAFPMAQVDPDSGKLYLGDILISLEQAKTQAKVHGNSLKDELQLLVVHGTLHLLGYDHVDPVDKDRMWEAQEKILRRYSPSIHLPE